jgi:hypothetical protein
VLVTAEAVGAPLFTVVTASFAGGTPSSFAGRASVYGRLLLSTDPDGGGIWSLADGGGLLSDGGACLDACEARFFTPSVDLSVIPAPGCFPLSDAGADATLLHVDFSSSPQTRTFQAPCYDLAFLATPGFYGILAPDFSACAAAARAAGFPHPDDYEVLLYDHPITGNGWVRPDGVPYLGLQSFAPVFIDALGRPNAVADAWAGAPGADCSGWMNGGAGTGFAVYPADEVADAGSNLLCAVGRPLRCFGSHWKNGAPPVPAAPAGARRAFVSSTMFHPGPGIAVADQLCRNEAADAGLPGVFMAFLSTNGMQASARLNLDAGNWYRVDDVPLLFQAADVASVATASFRVALAKTARNMVPATATPEVWVGDDANLNCADWTSAASSQQGFLGRFTSAANPALRDPMAAASNCNQGEHVYCFEN